LASDRLSPFLDPALKRAQLTMREDAWRLTLEAGEEFLATRWSSASSHAREHGQTRSNGSLRGRKSRVGGRRCAAQPSPYCSVWQCSTFYRLGWI
jgi:hypothetical protein